MKMFSRALAATALLLSSTAYAQNPAPAAAVATIDADPALWVVKDKDTTVYLFGTVHLLKPGLSWFDERVRSAFDEAQEVVLEVIEPEPAAMQGMVMKLAVDPDGPPLSQKLTEADRADYMKAMAAAGVPYQAFETLKPWMAGITLAILPLTKLGYDPNSGSEKVIAAQAKASGKSVGQLETVEQQLGFFNSLSEADQIAFLNSTVDNTDKIGPMMSSMVDTWAKGDPDALAALMNESMKETPQLTKVLLTDRNTRWAEWIDGRMDKPGTVFVAVGSGHLAGKGSVQDALKARKLKATRVKY